MAGSAAGVGNVSDQGLSGQRGPGRSATDKAAASRPRQVAMIFGGTGFIGTHLIDALVTSGEYAKIVCADLRLPRKRVPGVTYLTCDVRKPIEIVEESISEIYNLAAVHTTPGHEDHEYYETNVLGAIHVTDFATANNVALIIFTSSISVYGPTETAKNENSILMPISAYGRSKVMAEKIHKSWRTAQPGRRLIVVRPAVVFGPGEGGNFTRLAKSLKRGWFFYPGRKDTVKACGYVRELINTMAFAKKLGRGDVLYNFCYPQGYTIEQICDAFHRCGQTKKPLGLMPAWLLLTAAMTFERLNSLGLKNSVNRARVRKLMESTFITPQFLLDNNYEFETDLESSLRLWRDTSPVGELV